MQVWLSGTISVARFFDKTNGQNCVSKTNQNIFLQRYHILYYQKK